MNAARGNSFANGQTDSGPRSPYKWLSGYEAPRPWTIWDEDFNRLDTL